MIIYVVQIAAVLIVRGRPYNGESIVAVLVKGPGCMANWCVPMLTFSWSVVLPIGLLVIISIFSDGSFLFFKFPAFSSPGAERVLFQNGLLLRHVQLADERRLRLLAAVGPPDGHHASADSNPTYSDCRNHPVHPLSLFRTL